MSNLRRVPYTKPIPPDAEFITLKGKPHVRFADKDGKPTTAPLTRKGDRIRLLSKKWYGEFRDAECRGAVQRGRDAIGQPRANHAHGHDVAAGAVRIEVRVLIRRRGVRLRGVRL